MEPGFHFYFARVFWRVRGYSRIEFLCSLCQVPQIPDIFQVLVRAVDSICDSPEHPLFGAGIFLAELLKQLLGIFPFGMPVGRAGAFTDRKLVFVPKADDIRFIYIHQRTDHCQVHAVQICYRSKRVKTSLKIRERSMVSTTSSLWWA